MQIEPRCYMTNLDLNNLSSSAVVLAGWWIW